jgi:hypothetical protein
MRALEVACAPPNDRVITNEVNCERAPTPSLVTATPQIPATGDLHCCYWYKVSLRPSMRNRALRSGELRIFERCCRKGTRNLRLRRQSDRRQRPLRLLFGCGPFIEATSRRRFETVCWETDTMGVPGDSDCKTHGGRFAIRPKVVKAHLEEHAPELVEECARLEGRPQARSRPWCPTAIADR